MSKIFRLDTDVMPIRTIAHTVSDLFTLTEPEAEPPYFQAKASEETRSELEAEIAEKRRELEDIQNRALQIVADAEAKSLKLVEAGKAEVERIHQEAAAAGRDEGFTHGYEEAKATQQRLIAEAQELMIQADNERRRRIQSSESFLVELAIQVAKRIVDRELICDDGYVMELARVLLGDVEKAHRVELRVAPDEFELAMSSRSAFEKILLHQAECLILPDHSLHAGDVVIATEYGTVDGRLATRFDQVRQTLLKVAKEWEKHGSEAGGTPSSL